MTSAYAQKTIRTDADGRGSGRAGKGILDVYLAFRFGRKTVTILGATNVFARMKNLH